MRLDEITKGVSEDREAKSGRLHHLEIREEREMAKH